MNDRKSGFGAFPVRIFLQMASVPYGMAVSIRNYLYNKKVYKALDVPCRVVSIGNLSVGGTGKTPVTVLTARLLKSSGCSVAVVSRGYGRSGKEPLIVSDGRKIFAMPQEAGDEPHIIASSVPDIPVVVGADRYRAARLAFERFRPDVIVLDDGFQHRRLYRNVDIVTLDAENLYGNEHLLPRGILRESPYGLRRAKAVIVTRFREKTCRRDSIERMIRYYSREIPVFLSEHVPAGLRKPGTADPEDTGILKSGRIAAMSNIVNPESFRQMILTLGGDIAVHHVLPDHHRYTAEELDRIERESLDDGAGLILMTAKDERNLPDAFRFKSLPSFVLDIEAVLIEKQDEYLDIIAPGQKKTGKL
ncbi:tetraacyldisaccharide 4'-kinase [bacterium]|nr:tetraacyldisaccharide 4'-kinase [bacterium]